MNKEKVLKRILSKCKILDNGCIEWQGPVTNGYGKLSVDGKSYFIHRLVLFLKHDKWPEHTDHLCRNRRCVNELHLENVSQKENNKRTYQRISLPKKEKCFKGHEFTPENTYIGVDGRRRCRECKNDSQILRRIVHGRPD